MGVLRKVAGTILLLLALMVVVIGLQGPDKKNAGGVLDSPEASGQILGTFMFAIILGIGGAWLWQKPKSRPLFSGEPKDDPGKP